MWRPAVNRQPGYRRRGLVELETLPNNGDMIDLRLMSNIEEGSGFLKLQNLLQFLRIWTCGLFISTWAIG